MKWAFSINTRDLDVLGAAGFEDAETRSQQEPKGFFWSEQRSEEKQVKIKKNVRRKRSRGDLSGFSILIEMLSEAVSRTMRTLRPLLTGSVVLAAITAVALAQQPAATPVLRPSVDDGAPDMTTASYGDWMLRCARLATAQGGAETSPGESCEIVVSMYVQGQATPVAQLAIGYGVEAAKMRATAVLPSNIGLPSSVQLVADVSVGESNADVFELNWSRCLGERCYATADVSDDDLEELRPNGTETEGAIRFETALGTVVSIPITWKGFESAINALKATRA